MPGTNLTRQEAADRSALIGVQDYRIALDLSGNDATFRSVSDVTFTAKPGASTFIDLIAPEVRRVQLNGVDLPCDQVFADSRIQLPNLAADNHLRVEADCAYSNTGEGLHRFLDPADGQTYLYSQFEVADSRRVFAVFEQPDLKATFAFTITAPATWLVVSNSPAPEPQAADGDTLVWSFEPTPRISSYITAIVAGPYHRATGELTSADGRTIPLGVYCRPSLAEFLDTEEILKITRQGFAFYEKSFDYAYPFAKYDQLFVPEFNAGAMENAGCVTIRDQYVFRSKVPQTLVERRAITILHELAHMWFGDLVTMRWWNDLWLNESFAEYVSHLAAVEATEWTDAWTTFCSVEKTWAYRQDQLPTTHPVVAEINDLQDVEVNFDGITYAKGASVLRQLAAWVGTEQFLAGLATYFRKHQWGNTELVDLLRELEATSGRDLTPWAATWLQTSQVNLLQAEVSASDGVITDFTIRQQAPQEYPTLRPHRLAVGIYDQGADSTTRLVHRLELDVDGQATAVPELVGQPRGAIVLPNDGDLTYARIRLDEQSLDRARDLLHTVDGSLARTLIWSSAWDMTRQAQWPASDYVDLVLSNIGYETDSSLISTLLRQLSTSLELYCAPRHRVQLTEQAADRLGELLWAAESGSDIQLQLLKSFALHAVSSSQLAVIADLLEGTRSLPGLSIDTDLRWELLEALVAAGLRGPADIEAALAKDRTATGDQSAAACRSAVPTPQAKEDAWELIHSESVANAIQAATIAGFDRVSDRGLLEPFVERYFAELEEVWAERSLEMGTNIVVGLYPTFLLNSASAQILARTDHFLDQLGDRTPALRRLLVECRDGVSRSLAAQECDARAH